MEAEEALASLCGLSPATLLTLVDGNGTLHPARCGTACHLGAKLNLATIGVGKNLHAFEGLGVRRVRSSAKEGTSGSSRVSGDRAASASSGGAAGANGGSAGTSNAGGGEVVAIPRSGNKGTNMRPEKWLKDFLERERQESEVAKTFFSRELMIVRTLAPGETESGRGSSNSSSVDLDVGAPPGATVGASDIVEHHVGYAVLPHGLRNPLYVSAGHRVSQRTAKKLVEKLCGPHRIPLPVRLADLRSREVVRRTSQREE